MATGFDPKPGYSHNDNDSDSEDESTWKKNRVSPPYSKEDEEVAEMSRRGCELDEMLQKLRLYLPDYAEADYLTPTPIPEEPREQPGVPVKCSDREPSVTPTDEHVIPVRPPARNLDEALDSVPLVRGGWTVCDVPPRTEDTIWSFSDCFSAVFLASSIASGSGSESREESPEEDSKSSRGEPPIVEDNPGSIGEEGEIEEDSGSSREDPPSIDDTPRTSGGGIVVPVAVYPDGDTPDKRKKKKLQAEGKNTAESAKEGTKRGKNLFGKPSSSNAPIFSPVPMETDSPDPSSESTDTTSTGTCEYLATPTNKNLLHGEDNQGFVYSGEASGGTPSGSAGACSARTTPEDMDIDMDSPSPKSREKKKGKKA